MATQRDTLRIKSLKTRQPPGARLLNVRVPREIATAIDALAGRLGATKTEVVIALLNEGLYVARGKTKPA